ncbi:uncharacterized mitochondrial protein-like protein [Tanacetum coccineum]
MLWRRWLLLWRRWLLLLWWWLLLLRWWVTEVATAIAVVVLLLSAAVATAAAVPGTKNYGCGYFDWKDAFDERLMVSSSSTSEGSSGPYRSEPIECSNCKVKDLTINRLESRNRALKARLRMLEARLEMERNPEDHAYYSLFIFKKDACFVAALIYVDDVIMVGNDVKKIQHTEELDKRYSIKDLGAIKYFLSIEVARNSKGLVLRQRKYILDILEDCGFQGCKPSPFPFEQNLILDKKDKEPKVDAGRYRRLVAHQMLRYLKGRVGQGILVPRDGGCNLTAYCDSDWLGCPITRRSRMGYLLLFRGAPISWKTKKQNVVSRSSVGRIQVHGLHG